MSREFIVIEIDRASCDWRPIHEFSVPSFGEPKHYVITISIDAFRFGKRKGATAKDKAVGRDTCAWSPTRLYSVKTRAEYDEDQTSWDKAFKSQGIERPQKNLPVIKHGGWYEFLRHIGFDRKKRRYQEKYSWL